MRVTVVGSGPLGQFFAVHASWGGADVSMFTRRDDVTGEHTIRSRSMPFGKERHTRLQRVTDLNAAEAVIVAVRSEQMASVMAQLEASATRVVLVFTPLMQPELAELQLRFPNLRVGMPVLAAEVQEGVLRYWQAPSTLVQAHPDPDLRALVTCLRAGGVWVRTLPDVVERSSATTTAFFPMHLAIHACPELRAWKRQPALVQDLAAAMAMSRRLARKVGNVEPGVAALAWWLSKPWRIRLACAVVPRLAPDLTSFVEQHFGAKLGQQHVKLAQDIARMATHLRQPFALPPSLTNRLPGHVQIEAA